MGKLETENEVLCSVSSFPPINHSSPCVLPLPRTANWKPQGVRGVPLKRDTSILSFPAISEDHSDVQLHQPLQELGESLEDEDEEEEEFDEEEEEEEVESLEDEDMDEEFDEEEEEEEDEEEDDEEEFYDEDDEYDE